MLCLAGASWSFAQASKYLDELSGLKVSAGTVRHVCQREAERIEAWQANSPAGSRQYRQTPGNDEFETDGTCVNTSQGWKEMRVGVFARRQSGPPATAQQWATRPLPAPGARVAFAAIEDHETFAARWPVVAQRLGRWSTVDLGTPRLSLRVCAGDARYLSRPGARQRGRQVPIWRRNGSREPVAGPGTGCFAHGRLAGHAPSD
jgi:hypothetical protein